jgi:hypothetical protein
VRWEGVLAQSWGGRVLSLTVFEDAGGVKEKGKGKRSRKPRKSALSW